jgi:hypothetical protein
MAKQPTTEAGDGNGTIGQQTDREGWIAGWYAPQYTHANNLSHIEKFGFAVNFEKYKLKI